MQEVLIRLSLSDEHYELWAGRTVFLMALTMDEFRAVIEARNAVLAALPEVSAAVEGLEGLRRGGRLTSARARKLLDQARGILTVAAARIEGTRELAKAPFWTADPSVEANGRLQ